MSLTRRNFLSAMPLVAASAAIPAVAFANDLSKWTADPETKPVFVKVGSPSMSVSPEIMAAILDWKRLDAIKQEAMNRYQALIETARRIPDDNPIRNAWIDADSDATDAQHRLLRLLREVAA